MAIIQSLREMWQRQTGEEETPLDGDSPSFIVSLLVHMGVVICLGLIPIMTKDNQIFLNVSATPPKEELETELMLPEKFYFSDVPSDHVGANSEAGTQMALSEAPVISEVSAIATPEDLVPDQTGNIELNVLNKVSTGLNFNANVAVKGAVGSGTTGASGAIDRITHEILLSLEERKTLVVWLFDQTASLIPQRKTMNERFERIYRELGVIEAAGNDAFTRHDDKPLLSSVVSFGDNVNLITKKPTDNIEELKNAVANLPNDDSGNEKVFEAVQKSANAFANFRYVKEASGQPDRNVMIVVFTDEVGSDADRELEPTVKLCRRYAMPVYVVGVPAPFGRQETMMKWVDPDPKYDQSAQWGRVDQGPESLMPERIKLAFFNSKIDDEPIDSGFGPFALTRLCYETGGIYFAVHPNRNVLRAVSRNEVAAYSAHLQRFFDPEVMRPYRPDYVSVDEYKRRLMQNKCRAALVQSATYSQITPMESPQLRFVKRDEGSFSEALGDAQKNAAKLEPKIDGLFEVLKLGEGDRDKETTPRWQAGFDLAMGRVLAMKVRTESYNAMLAGAKRGLPFKDKKNNTWMLEPADEITVGSQLQKMAERAKMYLNRVVKDHADTPWALLAAQELKEPLGWKWSEEYTELNPMRMGDGGAAAAAANDAKMMLNKPAPKRAPPKL